MRIVFGNNLFFPVISVGCFSKKSVIELTRIMKTNVEME
jgi:hypothetical protein